MQRVEIDKAWLVRALEAGNFSEYYRMADEVRRQNVGDTVHVRALLEFSNYCRRRCKYCGLNCKNTALSRYRMTADEIIYHATLAADAGYKTVVLQSGEDRHYTMDELCRVVAEIKRHDIAVTLSCGEFSRDELSRLRDAGADRYLLKHETADEKIYKSLHPCATLRARIECLNTLKDLGYEVGSGFMIGLPGQTVETIAEDLLLLKSIGCDMAGIGPFLPHPDTELGNHPAGSAELCRRAVALARILMPKINLPATTALGVRNPEEKDKVFSGGANVIMQKITPDEVRALYEIYPTPKAHTDVAKDREKVLSEIRALGRNPV